MMINFKYIFTLSLVVFLTTQLLDAQQTASLPDGVIMAVKNSDAEKLSATFNEQVEIILPHKTAVYSRKQAEMVLKNFFEQNPITEFKLIHQGKKDKASYAIANYYTSNGQFRFTFLTKQKSGKIYIHQIRIERQ
ncbi:DUF4783 domain-containing protein [Carboxylicivirga mesophila]|uniref:DUF4783 domain-containing protein n=1 Tax=Carboxylicivirga mesophila TaxID=1166478 RepID=A0ABS5KE98_9BACT|nr:DUF4783 domain-containing protein [Carboxylicivirga mesophila]MBS2213172.1 DUF4783 domain-containing protein [Carboxylicivirga mesophila]